jgi:TolA-binding protein
MYESWLEAHPDHPLRGQARYELAWSMGRAGDEARAFQQFTNFLASFPRHERAQDAQYWVASYHFSQDRFDLAESGYQRVFQDTNWPPSEVTFRARMMAGRSAYRRTSYREARTYFLDLINTNCPVHLLPEAYFLLGHTIRDGAAATNKLGSLVPAIDAYSRVPMNYPESPWVPLAWLEVGNCRLQLATEDDEQYDDALAAYTNVLASALADVAARSQAEVGMAICLEKKAALAPTTAERSALLTVALAHYLNVTEGGNLRDGENADLFWVERAASGGGQLAEQLRRWEVAERLYLRFKESVPQFRDKYEARLQQLRRKMSP